MFNDSKATDFLKWLGNTRYLCKQLESGKRYCVVNGDFKESLWAALQDFHLIWTDLKAVLNVT